MELLTQLAEKRQRAWEATKAHVDEAEKRGEWTAEDQQSYDRLTSDIDTIDARMNELKTSEASAERASASVHFSEHRGGAPTQPRNRSSMNPTQEELRALARGEVRHIDVDFKDIEVVRLPNGFSEARDLSKLSAGAGANTVPTSFRAKLVEHLTNNSAIRQTNVTILRTDSGEDIQVPKTTGYSTGSLTAETASITESDPAFGQVTLGAYKYATFFQASRELMEDQAVDLEDFFARQAGRALANKSGADFTTGDGSAKPNGVVTASTLGVTAALAAAISADELIDLYHSVIPSYRVNAEWMMADSTWAKIRKMKDADNNYLVGPLTQDGGNLLLGKRVVINPDMPASTAGLKSVLFGDFSAYMIRDAKGIRFERSDDFAFQNDLVSFKAVLRTDGDLVDTTGAIKHLIQAAV